MAIPKQTKSMDFVTPPSTVKTSSHWSTAVPFCLPPYPHYLPRRKTAFNRFPKQGNCKFSVSGKGDETKGLKFT